MTIHQLPNPQFSIFDKCSWRLILLSKRLIILTSPRLKIVTTPTWTVFVQLIGVFENRLLYAKIAWLMMTIPPMGIAQYWGTPPNFQSIFGDKPIRIPASWCRWFDGILTTEQAVSFLVKICQPQFISWSPSKLEISTSKPWRGSRWKYS